MWGGLVAKKDDQVKPLVSCLQVCNFFGNLKYPTYIYSTNLKEMLVAECSEKFVACTCAKSFNEAGGRFIIDFQIHNPQSWPGGRTRFVHKDLTFLPLGTSGPTCSETCFFQSPEWPYGELGAYNIITGPESPLSSIVTGVSDESSLSRLPSSQNTITNW